VVVRVGPAKRTALCPHCGQRTGRRHARGKERRLWHGMVGRRTVDLVTRAPRLWCRACHKAFTMPLPGVARWQRRTQEAEVFLRYELRSQSFGTVTAKTGVGYWALLQVVRRALPEVNWTELLQGAKGKGLALGLDEHSFRHQDMATTLTELWQHRLLTILPDDRQKTLDEHLEALPSEVKQAVREVCIDMKEGFLSVVERRLPEALVVVDPFHVIQDANKRLDEARRLEQQMNTCPLKKTPFLLGKEKLYPSQRAYLKEVFQRYPVLKEFYTVKEWLRELYRLPTRAEAERLFSRILIACQASDDAEMVRWGRTLKRWRPFILNHFVSRTTNAFTEGTHTKIKLLKRVSYGFRNVQVYIQKMLLGFLPPILLTLPSWTPHFST